MSVDEQIAALIDDGKKTWLIIHGQRYDFDPPRNKNGRPTSLPGERRSMDRFAFQVDGFTIWDAEIRPDGTLKVLCNGTRHVPARNNVPDEEDAFRKKEFDADQIVTWPQLRRAVRQYVDLSCRRVGHKVVEWEDDV